MKFVSIGHHSGFYRCSVDNGDVGLLASRGAKVAVEAHGIECMSTLGTRDCNFFLRVGD
jgi:hypothetical protein